MFNSLRRVARTCPNAGLSVRPSTPNPGYVPTTASFTTRSHQRRNSSSKPPIPPNNGHPPIPAASVKQVGAPRSSDKRPGTESRLSKRRPSKTERVEASKQKDDLSNEWTRSLPSVPSTQHLNPKDIYVASFFATHRPLSISGPLPSESTLEDIDKIFSVRPKSQRKTQDVIYTISSAVQNLDDQVASAQHEESISQKADLIKALTQHNTGSSTTNSGDSSTHHLDGQPSPNGTNLRVGSNVKVVIQALARQFRPFNPPPAPTAAPEVEFFDPEPAAAASAKPVSEAISVQTRDQSTSRFTAPTPAAAAPANNSFFTPSFDHSSRRTRRGVLSAHDLFLKQQLQKRDMRRRPGVKSMLLISVKRQRRLKMKKHKYKKLQRRTRNLRRRQGKI